MFERIKDVLSEDTVFFGLLLILVGITSFGLGKWSESGSVTDTQQASIVLIESPMEVKIIEDVELEKTLTGVAAGKYVGSKNGSKYHLSWCPGAKQMKEENKVWFETKEAATAAGYTPAANCKGI